MNVKYVGNRELSPIEEKGALNSHTVETGVKEIYDDEMDSGMNGVQTSRSVPTMDPVGQGNIREIPDVEDRGGWMSTGNPNYQEDTREIPAKSYPSGAISRKEVPSRNSVAPGYSSPAQPSSPINTAPKHAPSASYSRAESRTSSRFSGVLRGPVPDMYVYGGETIEDDEELERLEEEERRIDEAIRESESRAQMREERDLLRTRIQERKTGLRDSL